MDARDPARIRLSGVIGGLSYALDLTEGEPPGHAVRSCVIGMRIADELGLDPGTRSRLFYALLMKDAGCSANSAKMAALFGADDHEAKRTAKRSNWSRGLPAFVWSLRIVAPEGGFLGAGFVRLTGGHLLSIGDAWISVHTRRGVPGRGLRLRGPQALRK